MKTNRAVLECNYAVLVLCIRLFSVSIAFSSQIALFSVLIVAKVMVQVSTVRFSRAVSRERRILNDELKRGPYSTAGKIWLGKENPETAQQTKSGQGTDVRRAQQANLVWERKEGREKEDGYEKVIVAAEQATRASQ